jgi:hypothetical protein
LEDKIKEKLSHILLAYSNYNNSIGYTQGMNYIAATLLMNYDLINDEELQAKGFDVIDDIEEDVFWIFVFIMEDLKWQRVMDLGKNNHLLL